MCVGLVSCWRSRARSSFLNKNSVTIGSRPLLSRSIQSNSNFFNVSTEVREAVESKQPVVALETTIYTHGLPFPENLDLSVQLERIVRENGAIPATIGVLDGIARVGMTPHELEALVRSPDARKLSRRDLGFATGLNRRGRGVNGGTTIAGTMVFAHLAGIKVFATGGLGGVHRGAETSLDISADLTELGRTPVCVISSGCKGFLDIPRTLEYLETEGVGVATFADGREDNVVDFPAFWSRESGLKSPNVLRDEVEAAAVIHSQFSLPMSSGLLFANPVPAEASIPHLDMQSMIEDAVESANRSGAIGSANTPFILNALQKLSGGKSVIANWALVKNNMIRGAKVACELSKLERAAPTCDIAFITRNMQRSLASVAQEVTHLPVRNQNSTDVVLQSDQVDVVVAGSIAIDLTCDYAPLQGSKNRTKPQMETSNPSIITQSLGGVGYNVAKAAHRAGSKVKLLSAVADDLAGRAVLNDLLNSGMDPSKMKTLASTKARTAQYVAINDVDKNLSMAMADMSIFETMTNVEEMDSVELEDVKPKWMAVDANWNSRMIHEWFAIGKAQKAHVCFEPVSVEKSTRFFDKDTLLNVFPKTLCDLATPSLLELGAMYNAARDAELFERNDWWKVIDAMGIPLTGARVQLALATSPALVDAGIPQQSIQLLPFIPCILTKLGSSGVLMTQLLASGDVRLQSAESAPYILSRSATGTEGVGGVYMRLFPAQKLTGKIVSVNGAGDCFLGALLGSLTASLAQTSEPQIQDFVDIAQQASVKYVLCREDS